ncbi:hypothetical protein F504_3481 [Ralstonia pseudosolanacearum FQY_4]|nr:hypothetical protein F504_3481 [Ralstonia pseudosolanacearum FQY_4]
MTEPFEKVAVDLFLKRKNQVLPIGISATEVNVNTMYRDGTLSIPRRMVALQFNDE